MKRTNIITLLFLSSTLLFSGCSLSKSIKGGAIGSTAGGVAGAIIGRASGNTAMGAVIGATVGGLSGSVIGNQMDKQAEEIKNTVPDVKVERVGEGIVIEFTSDVLFGFDSSNLKTDAKTNLSKLVTILNSYPDTNIKIFGYTDSEGSINYNQKLSERRAGAVSNYLSRNTIASNRLSTMGYGEENPKYSNDTEAGRDKNRRVEFAITANEKMQQEAR